MLFKFVQMINGYGIFLDIFYFSETEIILDYKYGVYLFQRKLCLCKYNGNLLKNIYFDLFYLVNVYNRI